MVFIFCCFFNLIDFNETAVLQGKKRREKCLIYAKICWCHWWARLLTQQTSITVYHPLSVSVCSKQAEVAVFRFPLYIYICCRFTKKSNIKQITEDQAIFLNPFTVCSSCKRKFVVCSCVDEEKNGSYPFANGLNGLTGLKSTCPSMLAISQSGLFIFYCWPLFLLDFSSFDSQWKHPETRQEMRPAGLEYYLANFSPEGLRYLLSIAGKASPVLFEHFPKNVQGPSYGAQWVFKNCRVHFRHKLGFPQCYLEVKRPCFD